MVMDALFVLVCRLVQKEKVAQRVGWLMPSGVRVYLIFIEASQFHVEDEGGVARNACCNIVFLTVTEGVGHHNFPAIAFHHVHDGGGKTHHIVVDAHDDGHICLFVEVVGVVGLSKHKALGIGCGWNEASQIVYADGIVIFWLASACSGFQLLDIDVVIVVQIRIAF